MTGLSACRRVASQQLIGLSSTCPCMPSSSWHSHDRNISAAIAAAWTTQALNALDVATFSPMVATPAQSRTLGRGHPQTICISWNGGACKFHALCNFRQICSSCYSAGHCSKGCPSWYSRRQAPGSHLSEGQRRPQTEEPPATC